MSQVAVNKTQLLSDLASSIGVSQDVAKSQAKLIADSYNSARVYAGSDERAFDWLKADSRTNLGGRFNKEILRLALDYIKATEGHIASEDYIRKAREERVTESLERQLEDMNGRTGSDLSVTRVAKPTAYRADAYREPATAATLYTFPGQLFHRETYAKAWRGIKNRLPSKEAFFNIRQTRRKIVYPVLGLGVIAALAASSYREGTIPNYVVANYFAREKPAVVQVVTPQKPKIEAKAEKAPEKAEKALEKAAPAVTPTTPAAAPVAPAAAVTPTPQQTYQDLVKRLGELEIQVKQQDYQTLKASVDKLRTDYDALKGSLDEQFKEVGGRLTALESLVQRASAQAPPAPTAATPAPGVVQKARGYITNFRDLLWNIVKKQYDLKDNSAIARQVNVVVDANPHLPHLRIDNRAVVTVGYATQHKLDIVKFLPEGKSSYADNDLAVVVMADGIRGDVLKPGDRLILPGLEEAVKKPVVEVPKAPLAPPPRVEPTPSKVYEPPKPTYKVPLEAEDITEPRKGVQIPPLRLEPSRPSTRVPLLPEDLTEPKILQVR